MDTLTWVQRKLARQNLHPSKYATRPTTPVLMQFKTTIFTFRLKALANCPCMHAVAVDIRPTVHWSIDKRMIRPETKLVRSLCRAWQMPGYRQSGLCFKHGIIDESLLLDSVSLVQDSWHCLAGYLPSSTCIRQELCPYMHCVEHLPSRCVYLLSSAALSTQ